MGTHKVMHINHGIHHRQSPARSPLEPCIEWLVKRWRARRDDQQPCCGTKCTVIAILATIGACILLPVLFTCTLPENDTIQNTHAHTCSFFDLETTSTHRCCVHAAATCSGCTAPAFINGGCAAMLESQIARNRSVGVTRTPCCDGPCCAESHTECDTCYRQQCSTDSNGHQHCTQVTEVCNCRTVCDRHSTEQGDIACGTCHDYKVGFSFTLNGETHNRAHKTSCGLTGRGVEDIAFGSLFLLPCVLSIPVFLLLEMHQCLKAALQKVLEEAQQRVEEKVTEGEGVIPSVKAYPASTAAVVESKDVGVVVGKSPRSVGDRVSEQAWAVLDDV